MCNSSKNQGYFRYVETIQEIHDPCCYRIKITQILLQKVQSVKLGLSKPCCLVCNFVICRIKEKDNRSSVSYSEYHNDVYPCTLHDNLPEAVLFETQEWVEALLRNLITSSTFQHQLNSHLKTFHIKNGSTASQEKRCINQAGSLECHVSRKHWTTFSSYLGSLDLMTTSYSRASIPCCGRVTPHYKASLHCTFPEIIPPAGCLFPNPLTVACPFGTVKNKKGRIVSLPVRHVHWSDSSSTMPGR